MTMVQMLVSSVWCKPIKMQSKHVTQMEKNIPNSLYVSRHKICNTSITSVA